MSTPDDPVSKRLLIMSTNIKPRTILGIAGSLRQLSYNRGALRAAAQLMPAGTTLDIFDLDGIPGFNEDNENNPPAKVTDLKQRIRAADALLIATPEYNYSVPGVLKNAIDWASRPYGDNAWSGKPAAIIGASIGSLGTARAQYHLRQIFVTLNVFAINQPEIMIADAAGKFDAHGNLSDEVISTKIRQMLLELVEWSARVRESP